MKGRVIYTIWSSAAQLVKGWLDGMLSQRKIKSAGTGITMALFITALFLYLVPMIQEISMLGRTVTGQAFAMENDQMIVKQKALLESNIRKLNSRLKALSGNSAYLVINTHENSFRLYKNRKLVREGICSTGSYVLLRGGGGQQWLFETPRGYFRVQSKTTSPVWKKPDWAFVEEALPVPPANDNSRFEYGVLGDYALGLGDGYLIHGTLYQRFLGLPVTHGCIRMNDADLEAVYNTLNLGGGVYIY